MAEEKEKPDISPEDQPDQVSGKKHDLPAEDPSLSDDETNRAVDDIVAHESDEVLESEDAAREAAETVPYKKHRGFWGSIGHFFKMWLGTSRGRWMTFLILILVGGGIFAVPEARYWTLDKVGVRAGSSVTVVDQITSLPLKGVKVTLAGKSIETGADGVARFTKLKLGPTRLGVEQPGFASVFRGVTIGWGSNPLGTVKLSATGVRYTIIITDYLTGAPVSGVLATVGNSTAQSDEKGKIELTLEDPDATGIAVELSKNGYRTDQVTLKAINQTTTAKLVINRKAVFVNTSSGKYDLYKSDIDGANREVILPGTGNETSNISLAVSPDGDYAALVSTRDNQKDTDGYLLNTLTLVNIGTGAVTTLSRADQIQLIDWLDTRLVYEQVSSAANVPDTSRYSVVGYDYSNNSRVQLAAAPKLNSVFSAQGSIYYGISANDKNSSLKVGFYSIKPDGSSKQSLYGGEVWSGLRTDYNTLALQTANGWFSCNLTTGEVKEASTPASYTNRLYRDNADRSFSVWANQDSLILYDVSSGKETTIHAQGGLNYPLQWLGSAIVFRLVANHETADYAIGAGPGYSSRKISDVANTYGFSAGQ